MPDGFDIDEERLAIVMNTVWQAVLNRKGIFKNGLKPFLPQWNLPKELEYSPQQTSVQHPDLAAKLLFTRTSCDKMSDSAYLHRKVVESWNNPERRWIFDPREVMKRKSEELDLALNDYFHYSLPVVSKVNSNPISAGKGYHDNALFIAEKFDNDPRNLILYKTVHQARECLMKLKGFGTGLANLLMIEYASREIALPLDPENIRPKVDRHKSRVPINTNAIILKNHLKERGTLHQNYIVKELEEKYLKLSKELGLRLIDIDAALWIIGSEICFKSDFHYCTNCPLSEGLCIANTVLNTQNGYFDVFTKSGERLDSRKHVGQTSFEFLNGKQS